LAIIQESVANIDKVEIVLLVTLVGVLLFGGRRRDLIVSRPFGGYVDSLLNCIADWSFILEVRVVGP
jgi:hypothetical protein